MRVEPQRRLYIPLPATVGSAAPYDSGLVRRRRCEAGLGAGPLSAEYVDIKPPKSLASITLDPYRENRTDPGTVCRPGGQPAESEGSPRHELRCGT